jgi:hypothetical protein
VPDRREYLFIEVDRQLEEVREQALALATRAGLVLGAVAIGTVVLAARVASIPPNDLIKVCWELGTAEVAAIATLAPALKVGPNPIRLEKWRSLAPDDAAIEKLLDAKVLLVGANRTRLLIMTISFYVESVAVVAAVILSLVTSAGK